MSRHEASAYLGEKVVTTWDVCEHTPRGNPCERQAVALRRHKQGDAYPVCAQHAAGEMVPLSEVIMGVQRTMSRKVDLNASLLADKARKQPPDLAQWTGREVMGMRRAASIVRAGVR